MSSFVAEVDRGVGSAVVCMSWCPNMDLLALAYASGSVEVRRLSWQRLFEQCISGSHVTSLCWSPDGQVLAVATASGEVYTYSVETGQQQSLPPSATASAAASITCMAWTAVSESAADAEADANAAFRRINGDTCSYTVPASRADTAKAVFSGLPALPRLSSAVYGGAALEPALAERFTSAAALNVLVTCDSGGLLRLWALGSFPLGTLEVSAALSHHWFVPRALRREATPTSILGVQMSGDLARMSVLVRVGAGRRHRSGSSEATLVYAAVDTSVLRQRRHELTRVAAQAQHISFLADYLGTCLNALATAWADARRSLDVKMDSLRRLFRDHGHAAHLQEEFLDLLVSGEPADALHQFLSQYMSQQSLARILKGITGACDNLVETLRANVLRAVEEVMLRLTEMRSLAHWKSRYAIIGLELEVFDNLINMCSAIVISIEQLQKTIFVFRCNFLNFFDWLTSCVREVADESFDMPPNVAYVDTDKVADFIQNDLAEDRIKPYLSAVVSPVDSAETAGDPRTASSSGGVKLDTASFIKSLSNVPEVYLRRGLDTFLDAWAAARLLPCEAISRCLRLDHVLPLCSFSDTCAPVEFALHSSASSGEGEEQAKHEHKLAFVHGGAKGGDCTVYVVRSWDCPVREYQVSAVSTPSRGSAESTVSLRFYSDACLAVLSAHTLGMFQYSQNTGVRLQTSHIAGTFFVDSVAAAVEASDTQLHYGVMQLQQWRRLPAGIAATDLAVCTQRGMASILLGKHRLLVYDTENHEHEQGEDDERDLC